RDPFMPDSSSHPKTRRTTSTDAVHRELDEARKALRSSREASRLSDMLPLDASKPASVNLDDPLLGDEIDISQDITPADPALELKPEETAPELKPEETEKDFDQMVEDYLKSGKDLQEGQVVTVPVVESKTDYILVDMGDKSEGIFSTEELQVCGNPTIKIGDRIAVKILTREDETGLILVSYREARAEQCLQQLRCAAESGESIKGKVIRAVKSGLLVDFGHICFMPASQIDDRKVEDLGLWIGKEVEAVVLSFDEEQSRAVVSRRRLLELEHDKRRKEALESIKEGQVLPATVKKLFAFGAVCSLGAMDGMIPREEISWDKVSVPSDYLKPGDELKVQVVSVDRQTGRITLSRRLVSKDPWETAATRYSVSNRIKGKVVGITSFGAFVKIEEGLTGLIHVSDMSWAPGNKRPQDFVQEGTEVEAVVLNVDREKKRLSLGLKQTTTDPWEEVQRKYSSGKRVKGVVTGLQDFGAFVKLDDNVEGLVHISDFSWETRAKHPSSFVKSGTEVECVILKCDREARRISLGIKQLEESPYEGFRRKFHAGSVVTGVVKRLTPLSAYLEISKGVEGMLHVSQIDTERVETPADKLEVGQQIEVKITKVDNKHQKISLSRRELLRDQEKREVALFTKKEIKGGMNLGEALKDLNLEIPQG
ncbi:MAG: S1 RNA-binding domain-containing protein, partial [bacterium]